MLDTHLILYRPLQGLCAVLDECLPCIWAGQIHAHASDNGWYNMAGGLLEVTGLLSLRRACPPKHLQKEGAALQRLL